MKHTISRDIEESFRHFVNNLIEISKILIKLTKIHKKQKREKGLGRGQI